MHINFNVIGYSDPTGQALLDQISRVTQLMPLSYVEYWF